MDTNTIPVNENTTIIVKSSGDLFLKGLEQGEVRFRGSEDRVRVHQSNDTLYVETRASLDLEAPRGAKIIVEKVGGSAFVQDLSGSLVVQKVGGDLSMQHVGTLRVDKVGGNFMLEGVSGSLDIEKVGGDLTVRQAAGPVNSQSAGGDTDVQALGTGGAQARTGGDVRLYITESLAGNVSLKCGGDIQIYLPTNLAARFSLTSGGENIHINLSRQETSVVEDVDSKHHEFSLGSGDLLVEAFAGGDVWVSDEAVEPASITAELERLENAWADARGRFGGFNWTGGFGFDRNSAWADMVSRRAQEAARRAEQRVQAATRRTEDQIRHAAEREMHRAFGHHEHFGPMPPMPPTPPGQRPSQVTEKERLMVLEMLKDNKITVEQAEKLLAALEGRFNQS